MITLWSGNLKKGWIGIHVINGVIHGRLGLGSKLLPFANNDAIKLVDAH
jgi:hypothetical protein